MSGFSAAWLSLREGADHAARSDSVIAAARVYFADRETIDIVDLACGTGSNLRALAGGFGCKVEHWHLVDHDPALLAAARSSLARWADADEAPDARLTLAKNETRMEISFVEADLARDADAVLADTTDLVTAAAFFDLVSVAWIEQFADSLALRRLPLLAALTYTGEERWHPAHAADAAVLQAFHRHQGSDKGFGRAAGPQGFATLMRALEARDYRVTAGASPWRLGDKERALVIELANGIAEAAAATGVVRADAINAWRAGRLGASCEIGHADLFAAPRSGERWRS